MTERFPENVIAMLTEAVAEKQYPLITAELANDIKEAGGTVPKGVVVFDPEGSDIA